MVFGNMLASLTDQQKIAKASDSEATCQLKVNQPRHLFAVFICFYQLREQEGDLLGHPNPMADVSSMFKISVC